MKDEPRHLHAPDAPPTVIHDPLADETILERWLREAMEKGTRFWLLVAGTVVVVVGLSYLLTAYTQAPSEESEAWIEVMVPGARTDQKYPGFEDEPAPVQPLLATAKKHPGTPAAHWAMIHAAGYFYQEGLRDLPRNRDVAKPTLNRAYDMYKKVAKAAPKDSPERLVAMLGMARALESRGELEDARKQYLEAAKSFPDSPEAGHAKERAKVLEDPEVVAFYDEFNKQDFTSRVSGPDTSASPLAPGLPQGHPPIGQPMFPNLGLPPGNTGGLPGTGPAPEPAPLVTPEAPGSESAKDAASELPDDPFAPSSGEGPKR